MRDLRIERFSDPAYLAHVAEGRPVPAGGWAITVDGDVFRDGVQVGRSGKFVFDRSSGTPYTEISYEAVSSQ
jgi:hypothetical protein